MPKGNDKTRTDLDWGQDWSNTRPLGPAIPYFRTGKENCFHILNQVNLFRHSNQLLCVRSKDNLRSWFSSDSNFQPFRKHLTLYYPRLPISLMLQSSTYLKSVDGLGPCHPISFHCSDTRLLRLTFGYAPFHNAMRDACWCNEVMRSNSKQKQAKCEWWTSIDKPCAGAKMIN